MSMFPSSGCGRPKPPAAFAPSGTRLIASTPQPIPTSIVPPATSAATMWFACWEEPHWQSTVVAAVENGRPIASHAVRAMLKPCSPDWVTQPPTTCSTASAGMSVRFSSSRYASPSR